MASATPTTTASQISDDHDSTESIDFAESRDVVARTPLIDDAQSTVSDVMFETTASSSSETSTENLLHLLDSGFIHASKLLKSEALLKTSFKQSLCYKDPEYLLQTICCYRHCSLFFSRCDVMMARTALPLSQQSRGVYQQALMRHCFHDGKFCFKVGGRMVCDTIFCGIFAIGRKRYSAYVDDITNDMRTNSCESQKQRRIHNHTPKIMAHLAAVVDAKGQDLPDCEGFIMPPGYTRADFQREVDESIGKSDNTYEDLNRDCKCDCHNTPYQGKLRCKCQHHVRCRCKPGTECKCRKPSKALKLSYYRKKFGKPIRFRRQNSFLKCEICVTLRESWVQERDPAEKAQIMCHFENHWANMKANRAHVEAGSLMSVLQPRQVLSMWMDGMSKMSTKLPHLRHNRPKSIADNELAMFNNDCVLIDRPLGATKFTLENYFNPGSAFPTDANGAISIFIEALSNCDPVSPTILLNMDNCRVNKNYNWIAALGWLLLQARGMIEEIVMQFLDVGHTHGPVDGSFGRARSELKNKECKTPSEMLQLFRAQKGNQKVVSLLNVYAFDKLFEGKVNRFNKIDQARYIRIYLDKSESTESEFGVPMVQCAEFIRAQKYYTFSESSDDYVTPVFKPDSLPLLTEMPAAMCADPDKANQLLVVIDRLLGSVLTKEEADEYYRLVASVKEHHPPPLVEVLDRLRSRCSVQSFRRTVNESVLMDADNKLVKKYINDRTEKIQRSWLLEHPEDLPSTCTKRLKKTIAKLQYEIAETSVGSDKIKIQRKPRGTLEAPQVDSSALDQVPTQPKRGRPCKAKPSRKVVNQKTVTPIGRKRGRPCKSATPLQIGVGQKIAVPEKPKRGRPCKSTTAIQGIPTLVKQPASQSGNSVFRASRKRKSAETSDVPRALKKKL